MSRFTLFCTPLILLSLTHFAHSGEVVDAVTQASSYYATTQMSQAEVIDLVLNRFFDRVLVVGTTNPDKSPNSGVFTLTSIDEVLMIYGSDAQQTIRNLIREKIGLVTLYLVPQKGEIWSKHRGARIAVRLIEDPQRIKSLEAKKGVGDEAGSWFFLEITEIKPLG